MFTRLSISTAIILTLWINATIDEDKKNKLKKIRNISLIIALILILSGTGI